MRLMKNKALVIATTVYWFLLLYIVAAQVWWYIALQRQNRQMTAYKLVELQTGDPDFHAKLTRIKKAEQVKTAQYMGEGAIFLLFTLVGAVFVYRAVHRQFRLSQQQQNFMMAITHELKTPIAVTKLNLETLKKHKLDDQRQQHILQMTLQETERLNTLASNILISSQLDAGGYNSVKEDIDLSDLATGCIRDAELRFTERSWRTSITKDIAITGDILLLQIMINNLLENAIKYSPAETAIGFRLERQSRFIELQVIDEGPGIPDKEKKKIFDRFYRIGNETIRTTQGTGLGLYLCRKIAAYHNAAIFVTDNRPAGSKFAIQFKVLS